MTRDELKKIGEAEQERIRKYRHQVHVCMASGCHALRSDKVRTGLQAEAKKQGREGEVLVKRVGCLGLCSRGPLVLEDQSRIHTGVAPEEAGTLLRSLGEPEAAGGEPLPLDHPFFKGQRKIVMEHSGAIDPERIEEYIAVGGYEQMLAAIIDMAPEAVIDQVTRSGLRGRGGAGYPTGLKWSTVAKAGGGDKYVICNADEGDPGAFMDRSVMESTPHQLIEGMIIAGYAVGANHGVIYVRAEYPLAIARLEKAIGQAEKMGLLGRNIGATRFSFDLQLRYGAGAFVTGEETALIASVEGRRGTPRSRPPYPAERGLWGRPTLINNVETLANVVPILKNGGDWYAGIGAEKSRGTKVFALVGRVNNVGLIEVPLGITLREIIEGPGGGIPGGRKFKAVQTGGPSGGCIPEASLDLPVDYESLVQAGSIMGSGGMIVMDETSCMVDVAKYFMQFCMSESCGKCIPCRVGTVQMHHLLEKMTTGSATGRDLEMLEELCDLARHASLCGLGQSAPNPVLSTLRYFRDEYLAHIDEKRCPAGVCTMGAGG
ncbi:MAG: NADH-quinone oxidoreductase subunit NuoF [Desulfobacteraceae bacterium]|nr:NADH-quinone oxidoreductase subunit NuoF [Desulfobacteraceae bacterium]